jgi:hypothetical protein
MYMHTKILLHKCQLMIKETHVKSQWLVTRHMITYGTGSVWIREVERTALHSYKIYDTLYRIHKYIFLEICRFELFKWLARLLLAFPVRFLSRDSEDYPRSTAVRIRGTIL